MSTYITFTIDDLDAEVKDMRPQWANRSDFATLRNMVYRKALAAYEKTLRDTNDIFIRKDTFGAPVSIGTEEIATTIGNIWQAALPAGAYGVAGDAIMVEKSTTEFLSVPRLSWQQIVPSGADQTISGFWENDGNILIYDKDTTFASGSSVCFDYYRRLDATQTTGTALDIKAQDFPQLVSDVVSYLESYV